jgi:hypothetical protein
MAEDRTETRNVESEHPEILRKMVARWEQWIQTR